MRNEIKNEMTAVLDLKQSSVLLDQLVKGESRYIKDLKLNFKTVLQVDPDQSGLNQKESHLIGLAIAVNNKSEALTSYFTEKSRELEASEEEIAETVACASLLSANNILYRFRHFVETDNYKNLPARIRMNIMAKPVMGKELFELISLAVSAVNGCEACVRSHEQSVKNLGSGEKRIFSAIRIASVVTSMDKVVE